MSLTRLNINLSVGQTEPEPITVTTSNGVPYKLTGFTYELIAKKGDTTETIPLGLELGYSGLWLATETLAASADSWSYQIDRIKDGSGRKSIFKGQISIT